MRIARNAIVSCSDQQMYQLVADIHSYQEFLPWCRSASSEALDDKRVRSTLTIHKSGIDLSFTTINTYTPYQSIVLELADGPFRELSGIWTFEKLGEHACRVALEIDFEVAKGVGGTLIAKIFKLIADSLVDSFVQRSKQIYG